MHINWNEIKKQIKIEVSKVSGANIKKREQPELIIAILQQYVKNCLKQMMVPQDENEELEQYVGRLYFRLKVVSSTNRETSEVVLQKFQLRIKELQ